jgi:NitT/TauT family transport system substrate-binding protein
MRSMKKILSVVLILALALSFAACGSKQEAAGGTDEPEPQPQQAEDVTIRIAGLKGPTSMGLVKLMDSNEAGESLNHYEFSIAGSADEITPQLVQGNLDIAAVPANLASVLYNKTEGQIRILAVNTLGVLYIVNKDGGEIASVADLAGKTIYATGKGSTPEYTLRYILAENGLDPDKDVTIEFKSEPTEVVSILQESGGIAMLPQPFATVAQMNVEGLTTALDLTEEWNKLDNGSMLITGTLVVRKDFAEAHPAQIEAFLSEYADSTDFAVNSVAETAQLVEKYGIVKAAVAEKALPKCNIVFLAGADMKAPLSGYLSTLFEQNPAAVGGALPGEDFFYEAENSK